MAAPKAIGSTWLFRYRGKEWPVVLCDDDTPPNAFIKGRPNPFLCPAILLGKHIFVWVKANDLQNFEPGRDYAKGLPAFETDDPVATDADYIVEEKLRRKALRVDAMHFENHEFWNNYILAKSEIRKQQNEARRKLPLDLYDDGQKEMDARAKSRRTNRRGSRSGHALLTPESMPRKKGSGRSSVRESIEIIDNLDESLFVRESRRLSDSFQSEGENNQDDGARLEAIRQNNIQKVKDRVRPDDMCTIFVGTEYTPFTVSRAAMGKCDYLVDREAFQEAFGSHINLYEDNDIEKDGFKPIGDYLRGGDFAPRFAKTITTDRFEEAIFMPDQMDEAAQSIVRVYHIAAKIRFENVQKHCLRKLQLLDSLSPSCLLLVAKIVHLTSSYGAEVEEAIFEWLADQISRRFWKMVQMTHMQMSRVLREDVELSARIFEKLASDPTCGGEGIDDE